MAGVVLWNFRANATEQMVAYYFALSFDESRELEEVTGRILLHFAPTDNNQQRDGKLINLKYRVLCFDTGNISPPENQDWRKIFAGRVRKDGRLYLRDKTGMDGLEAYAVSAITNNCSFKIR